MPQNNLQVNLILAGDPGETDSRAPHFRRVRNPESGHWAEMMARIGNKSGRLYSRVSEGRIPAGGDGLALENAGSHSTLEHLETERSRIARDLHAGAGQPLAGIILNLELLDGMEGSSSPEIKDVVGRLRYLAAQALDQVRAASHRLHPPDWQRLTLAAALKA